MYYLLHRNQLHVSTLFIGHLLVDNEKLNKQLLVTILYTVTSQRTYHKLQTLHSHKFAYCI